MSSSLHVLPSIIKSPTLRSLFELPKTSDITSHDALDLFTPVSTLLVYYDFLAFSISFLTRFLKQRYSTPYVSGYLLYFFFLAYAFIESLSLVPDSHMAYKYQTGFFLLEMMG